MADVLGFRFYWTTNSPTEQDLKFKANEEGRTTKETIKYI